MKQVSDVAPWLMPAVIEWLARTVRPTDTVLETGAGGSTVFFCARAAHTICYEHTSEWAAKISASNLTMRHWPSYPTAGLQPETLPPIDLAFIDGRGRVRSVLDVLPHIKPGGWLVLDDSDRPRYAEAHRAAGAVCHIKITWHDNEGNETTAWQKD